MIQVRENVFETNSSSTHSLVIAKKSEFEDFKAGKSIYCQYSAGPFEGGKFYAKAEVDAWANENEDDYDEWDFQDYDEFFDNEYLESYEEEYTTEYGDELVIFGNYGYDG